MTDIAPRVAEEVGQSRKHCIRGGRLEGMTWVVTVLVANVTLQAEVVVVTGDAGDKLLLGEDLDAAITGASGLLFSCNRLLLFCVCSGNLLVVISLSLDLGWDTLSGAVDNASILHEALDHPVALSRTVDASIDAGGAEIIVAAIANAAVEVLVFHGMVAVVAVHDPGGADIARLRAESKSGIEVVEVVGCESFEEG